MKSEYRDNPCWDEKKRLVRERSGGICERCGCREAEHVHHLWYNGPIGSEQIYQLQHVCLDCHEFYHPHRKFRGQKAQRKIARRRKRKNKPQKQQPSRGKAIQKARAALKQKEAEIDARYAKRLA